MASCSVHKAGGRRREWGGMFEKMAFEALSHRMESCSPKDGWTAARPWKVVSEFLAYLWLHTWLLLYLLNCLIPWVSQPCLNWPQPMSFLTLTLLILSLIPPGWSVSEWVCGAELPPLDKLWYVHYDILILDILLVCFLTLSTIFSSLSHSSAHGNKFWKQHLLQQDPTFIYLCFSHFYIL